MGRYALLIEYDGSRFCGFQRQADRPSVQQFLEETLAMYLKHETRIHVAGRTDTGVHALGQVAHFESNSDIDLFKLKGCLNHFGSAVGVSIVDSAAVSDDFHARFSAMARSYVYLILNRHAPSPLMQGRCTHIKEELNIDLMNEGAQKLQGHHNFESFRSIQCQAQHALRTLDVCSVVKEGNRVAVHVQSRSFLHNQVRIMVGSLLEIGKKRKPPSWIDDLLNTPDRTKAGPTAPPYGLYFKNVVYEKKIFKKSQSFSQSFSVG